MSAILSAISAGIASTTDAVGDVLVANLPEILGVFGALVALGLILRLVKRTIGRRA